ADSHPHPRALPKRRRQRHHSRRAAALHERPRADRREGLMLKSQLLHPQILQALARAGHGAKVLISDGNYPHWPKHGPNAEVVFLNLAPGQVLVTDVLKALMSAIPIEKAEVMDYAKTGPNSLSADPPIWNEFRQILHDNGADLE